MAYALRGNAWLMKGDYDRGWDDLNRAIKIDDKNAYAFVSRGNYASQVYDYKDAIVDFDRAILLDPNYKAAYRYRDEAIRAKNQIWWGKIYEVLFGAALLAMLYGAFRTYRSPTAFSHSIELRFTRLPNGTLIFGAPPRWGAYIVRDSEKEQELRIFTRHFMAVGLATPLVIFLIMFALVPATWQLLEVLRHPAGISTGSFPLVGSICVTSLIFTVLFVGVWLWRRASVRGLAKSEEKLRWPRANEWLTAFFDDMPVTVRWIVAASSAYFFVLSILEVWRSRYEFRHPDLATMSGMQLLLVTSHVLGLLFFGQLLLVAVRQLRLSTKVEP